MKYKPHEYQEYAKEFIIGQKVSALFLDCGLGKDFQGFPMTRG